MSTEMTPARIHRQMAQRRRAEVKQKLSDLVRGICGGFLFGIPLFYTMEVWWIGSSAEPPVLLAAIAITLLVVFLLNLTEGFRKTQTKTIRSAINDTVDAVAIGLLNSAWMLMLLQEITPKTNLSATLGKIIFESVPFALGVALANQFLSGSRFGDDRPNQPDFLPTDNLNETAKDIGATLIGALMIAFNISPTDELPMLAAPVRGPWLLVIVLSSLVISYGIVFQADFTRQSQRHKQKGLFQSPIGETIMSYLVSLLAATLMLYFFQQIDLQTPWMVSFSYVLILGLPATIGGAAGRLAL
jgi:putative integral membrane protein (TIGR02587 family)